MAPIPTPLRAALGLVASAIDEARSLPDRAVELPVIAVSSALQFSLRAQQRYAELTLRGDELIGRLHAPPEEPPPWATFDEEDAGAPAPTEQAPTEQAPAEQAPGEQAAAETAAAPVEKPRKRKAPAKAGPAKAGPAKASAAKASTAKASTAKASATKRSAPKKVRAPRKSAPSAFDAAGEAAAPTGAPAALTGDAATPRGENAPDGGGPELSES